jgi:hypothetical protein
MFRSSTILKELVLSLAKVTLKHSVKYVVIYYMNRLKWLIKLANKMIRGTTYPLVCVSVALVEVASCKL